MGNYIYKTNDSNVNVFVNEIEDITETIVETVIEDVIINKIENKFKSTKLEIIKENEPLEISNISYKNLHNNAILKKEYKPLIQYPVSDLTNYNKLKPQKYFYFYI